jgi:LytS/YehU family sensor histidine kinase
VQHDKETMSFRFPRFICTGTRYRIVRHLLALLVVAAIICNTGMVHTEPFASYTRLLLFALLVFIFYTNMYWLVPHYLLRNKYLYYGLGILVYMVLATLLVVAIQSQWQSYMVSVHKTDRSKVVLMMFMIVLLVGASTAIKLFQRWMIDTERLNELLKTTMTAELEQLKNQINPHFLFNMLNNASVLTKRDPEKAAQVLMKLSDLLRYQLYDSTRPKVLLTADIDFITDFLNLEKIRRDDFEFIVSKEGELSAVQIPSLLFITFVENAVKYSMDAEKRSYVHIDFEVGHHALSFTCVNSKPRLAVEKNGTGGLGLANARRRLELLFPNRHLLNIQDNADTYNVTLTIQL